MPVRSVGGRNCFKKSRKARVCKVSVNLEGSSQFYEANRNFKSIVHAIRPIGVRPGFDMFNAMGTCFIEGFNTSAMVGAILNLVKFLA